MNWIQQKTNKSNSVPINDISGYIFTKFSSGKSLTQPLFPPLSIQKFNKHLKLLLEELKFNRLIKKPRQRGADKIDTERQPIHQLISSHSGRHAFITNSIELGTMDYKTIMSLSGHTTTSSFLGYVSVLETQREKVSNLYRLVSDNETNNDTELTKKLEKLTDKQKSTLLRLIDEFIDMNQSK